MRASRRLLVVVTLMAAFHGSSVNAQEASRAPIGQTLAISPYRDLADAAFKAFDQGDREGAAKNARSLEQSWDTNTSILKLISPGTWKEIDRAMDVFIDPLGTTGENTPSTEQVRAAYRDYLAHLEKAKSLRWPTDISLNPIRTPSGIVCVVTRQGTGRQPKPGEIVILRVTGFANGKEFRRTKDDSNPDWFWLLGGTQPLGVIEGMSLLHVGDSAVLIIPPGLGYGPKGSFEGAVPPDAELTYVVAILDVKSKEIYSVMTETIESRGVDAAVEQYRALQQNRFPDVYINEKQMNGVGYALLKKKDAEGAIKIFKLNVEAYPQSANVHDSLGEAYAKQGDKRQAIEQYRQALAIDPKMESSRKALTDLGAE